MLAKHAEFKRMEHQAGRTDRRFGTGVAGRSSAEPERHARRMRVRPVDEAAARLAGQTCGAANTTDVVDAIVVAIALASGSRVFTSDPVDLKHLADAIGAKLQLHPV